MHILFCTLALLLCSLSALAQNNHRPQPLSIPGYGLGALNDTALFAVKQKHFALGWHWGATAPSRVINNIMRINNIHGQLKVSETAAVLPDSGSVNFLLMPRDQYKFGNREAGFEYIAAIYDARASEDYSDSLRWSWGFGTRQGSDTTVEDGSKRFVVGAGVSPGTVVLSNVTHKSVLKWNRASEIINTTTGERSADQMENSGSRYYLSINLRRMDANGNAMNNDTVLKVKLKYQTRGDTVNVYSIMFDSVSSGGSVTLPNRGNALSGTLVAAPSKPREFVITRNMLPAGDSSNKDITLHAYFRADSLVRGSDTTQKRINADTNYSIHINHPMEWISDGDNQIASYQIKELDVEVQSMGNSSIGINYVRIATKRVRRLAEGDDDDSIAAVVAEELQRIDSVRALAPSGVTLKLHSLYGFDEPEERHWYAQRLFHYLLSGRLTAENDRFERINSQEYIFNTRVQEPWLGSLRLVGRSSNKVAVPYMDFGTTTATTFALQRGRLARNNPLYNTPLFRSSNDKAGSQYEETVFFPSGWSSLVDSSVAAGIRAMNDSVAYLSTLGDGNYLTTSEVQLYKNYFRHSDFLYDTTRLWQCNVWLLSSGWRITRDKSAGPDKFDSIEVVPHRPRTGEEIRADIWNLLIMGTKGIFYDRMYTTSEAIRKEDKKTKDNMSALLPNKDYIGYQLGAITGRTDNPTCTVQANLLLCEDFGGDYIVRDTIIGGNRIVRDSTYFDKYTNLDNVANAMGVASNRIYVGRKSKRTEAAKINQRIAQMSDTLMQMRLVAWHGKGVRTLRNGDTTKLDSILAMNEISTLRKHPIHGGQYPSDIEKPWEQFYDITLHRLADKSMDSAFVLGVMNRRTNPLLGREGGTGGDTIRFISTADFDAMVSTDTSKYYAQGGARSIKLPFSYIPSHNGQPRSVLLRIREMGCVAGKPCVDTVISGTRDLTVHFQPGEGKLLYVQVLGYDTKEVIGDLRYTNQRKIVAEPRGSDTVVYHAVYQREVRDPYPHTEVMYRRSVPTHISSPQASGIEWEPFEARLSEEVESVLDHFTSADRQVEAQNMLHSEYREAGRVKYLECGYPSVVVSSGTVRVVFACLDFEFYTLDDVKFSPISHHYLDTDTVGTAVGIYESFFASNEDISSLYPRVQPHLQGTLLHASSPRQWSSFEQWLPPVAADPNREHHRPSLAKWGTPMIGAAPQGDIYYTWSDSALGIGVSAGNWADTAIMHLRNTGGTEARHPSLPSYVDAAPAGRAMSVVWQEGQPLGTHIYYAQVQADTSGLFTLKKIGERLVARTAKQNSQYPQPSDWGINSDSTILRLTSSECRVEHIRPSIIRALEDGSSDIVFDIVGWTAVAGAKRNVLVRSVGSSNVGMFWVRHPLWNVLPSFLSWSELGSTQSFTLNNASTMNANLTNGIVRGDLTLLDFPINPFRQGTALQLPTSDSSIILSLHSGDEMWQVPLGYREKILTSANGGSPFYNLDSLPPAYRHFEKGYNANLAAASRSSLPYRAGRRIYNKYETNPASNTISSTAIAYFRLATLDADLRIPRIEVRTKRDVVNGICRTLTYTVTIPIDWDSFRNGTGLLAFHRRVVGIAADTNLTVQAIDISDTLKSHSFTLLAEEEFNP